MSRPPRSLPMVDLGAADSLTDPTPARAAILLDVDARQQALISAYGAPAVAWALAISDSTTTTHYLPLRACGIQYARIGLLVSGDGTATITTAADATGVVLRWYERGTTAQARWVWTTAADPLEVFSAATRQWGTELAEMVVDPGDTDAVVYAVAMIPHHPAI